MTTLHYVVLESNNSSQLLRILTAKLQGCVFVVDRVDVGRVDGVDGADSRSSRFSERRSLVVSVVSWIVLIFALNTCVATYYESCIDSLFSLFSFLTIRRR